MQNFFLAIRRKDPTQRNARIGSESILASRCVSTSVDAKATQRNATHCLASHCEPAFILALHCVAHATSVNAKLTQRNVWYSVIILNFSLVPRPQPTLRLYTKLSRERRFESHPRKFSPLNLGACPTHL